MEHIIITPYEIGTYNNITYIQDMKEQLITFETAKLAKEKGFDEYVCLHYSNYEGVFMDDIKNYELDHTKFSAPTQSLLQKWLREEHDKELFIYKNLERSKYICYLYSGVKRYSGFTENEGETYEQALEKGLIEALKLI